jgi:hypothetical protein
MIKGINLSEIFSAEKDLIYFRILLNRSTGNYELISRSGDIICIVPRPAGFSASDHEKLARFIIRDFSEGRMYEDDSDECNISSRLICINDIYGIMDKVDFEYPNCDDSSSPIVEYN